MSAIVRHGIMPRFIRAGAAPAYLAMSRDEFNKTVRPYVREFPIGIQGVGFDRQELDAWADAYAAKRAIDKPAVVGQQSARSERQGKGAQPWQEKPSPASRGSRTASGRSTKSIEESEFKK